MKVHDSSDWVREVERKYGGEGVGWVHSYCRIKAQVEQLDNCYGGGGGGCSARLLYQYTGY